MRDSYISRRVVGIYHNREIKYERFGGRPGAPGALKSGPAYLHKLDQTELTRTVTANVSYFAPNRAAKYCDEHVCSCLMCPRICLSASISPKPHDAQATTILMHVTYGRRSVPLSRRCNTLCISGFTDDVILDIMARNRRLKKSVYSK